jgi:hypothetical protein
MAQLEGWRNIYGFRRNDTGGNGLNNQLASVTWRQAIAMRKLTPINHLWILFCLQCVLLVSLLAMFAFFEPRFAHLVTQNQESDSKIPELRQRILQADPERLQKDALILLDSSSAQSQWVQAMENGVIRLLGTVCILVFILTGWLGVIIFQLHKKRGVDSAG